MGYFDIDGIGASARLIFAVIVAALQAGVQHLIQELYEADANVSVAGLGLSIELRHEFALLERHAVVNAIQAHVLPPR